MALLQLENVNVHYREQVLYNINLCVEEGSFVTIFGASGSGKSTLLKQLKPTTTSGKSSGDIYFDQVRVAELSEREQVTNIGYVYQNPDEQLMSEDVWHELAFGLENIGLSTADMKIRIGEMANFFGIQKWFRKKIHTLSGGQKQILNLAAVLVLHPKLLILDEPTAQLDPIAAKDLLDLLGRINRDLGVTIILVEHRLDDLLPHTSHFVFMEEGQLKLAGHKASFFQKFIVIAPKWQPLLPAVIQLSLQLDRHAEPAWTIQQALMRLSTHTVKAKVARSALTLREPLLTIEKLSFRYERFSEAILNEVSLQVKRGEILTLVGGNGAGKTTLLQLIAGQKQAFSGQIFYKGEKLRYKKGFYSNELAFLPQDPSLLFLENSVQRDYEVYCKRHHLTAEKTVEQIRIYTEQLQVQHLLKEHPADLSGGEKQKIALCKLLLTTPKILLLDEPTKGLDPLVKNDFVRLLKELQNNDMTIVLVTHDLEFAAQVSDRCGLLFDGEIVALTEPQDFFKKHHFYTTAARLISKKYSEDILLTSELIESLQQGEMNDE